MDGVRANKDVMRVIIDYNSPPHLKWMFVGPFSSQYSRGRARLAMLVTMKPTRG